MKPAEAGRVVRRIQARGLQRIGNSGAVENVIEGKKTKKQPLLGSCYLVYFHSDIELSRAYAEFLDAEE
jgi:hypothetical protein